MVMATFDNGDDYQYDQYQSSQRTPYNNPYPSGWKWACNQNNLYQQLVHRTQTVTVDDNVYAPRTQTVTVDDGVYAPTTQTVAVDDSVYAPRIQTVTVIDSVYAPRIQTVTVVDSAYAPQIYTVTVVDSVCTKNLDSYCS